MHSAEIKNYSIVILAGGASKRLGSPKQLVTYKGTTLLNYMIETASQTGIENIIVVLGAHSNTIRTTITTNNLTILENTRWQEGMSTSIVCALNHVISDFKEIEYLILMVCDQPFVDAYLLLGLVSEQQKSAKPIVASAYEDIVGTPALFSKIMFEKLLGLNGDMGASKFIKQNLDKVAFVPFAKGDFDIDTPEDLKILV